MKVIRTEKAAYKAFLPHPSKAQWVGLKCPKTHYALAADEEVELRGLQDDPEMDIREATPEDVKQVKSILDYCPKCDARNRCYGLEGNKVFLRKVVGS